ncbi:hypothetical protein OAP94_01050 [bacterium]|jgi:hypothetical protein|nr:hypothetical protein [bacterium]MDC1007252.1 hypothetical protein [bacterium]
MPSNSETILTSQTHPADSSIQNVTGDDYKGDGYYGRSDGIHTVQYSFTDLQGTITIQGTLATTPTATDWFDVHTNVETSNTGSKVANFTGNYVWIRAKLTYTAGSVSSIQLNH